jgi:hypothetical protein
MFTRIINIIIGLWLMISPAVLSMNPATSDNNHVIGPLVITFSIISLWDINRNVIKANVILGAWLIIALFVLHFTKTIAFYSNGACACFLIILSSINTPSKAKFGGGWRSLFQHNPVHMREAEKTS